MLCERKQSVGWRWIFVLLAGMTVSHLPALALGSRADSLEYSLKLENRPEKRLRILLSLAEELSNGNTPRELTLAREALRIAEQTRDKPGIIASNTLIASYYRKNGDFRNAILTGRQAMEMSERSGLDEQFIKAALVLGYAYDATGNYARSTELFFDGLKRSEKIRNQELKARALYGIGYTCFNQNKYPKALDYYQQALTISREQKDSGTISACLNNISAVYGITNDTQYVEKYLRESLAFNLKMKNQIWVSVNYNNLSAYFVTRRQFDSAFHYLRKAYDLAASIGNITQMATASKGLAQYYLRVGNLDSALVAATRALSLSRQFGLRKTLYETAKTLRDIYLKKNDPARAYQFDTLRYQLKDSLDLGEKAALLSKFELQYTLEKTEQEKKLTDQRRQAVYLILLVSLVSGIVIVILFFIRHRLKSRLLTLEKEKLELELEQRNRELASNVMSLMKKNEILSAITSRLIDLKQMAVKEDMRNAIDYIAGDLQKSMDAGIWEEFDLRFRQVHTNFYEKLLQKYPDLSPNEQKLCAFLRLNMTNKEISELTGQSIKALEAARYRLRMKLGLSSSQVNLIAFLSAF